MLHLFFGVCTTVLYLLGVLWVPCVIWFGFLFLVGVSCPLNVARALVAVLLFLVGVLLLMFRSLVVWVVFAS